MKLERQPVIPRADLKAGIERCFGQARELLERARVLAEAGKTLGAAELFVHATQELGKAVLLREAFDSGAQAPRIESFSNHDVKVAKGATVMGSSAMWLSAPAFQSDVFQPNAFQVGVPANELSRLQALYVNFGSTGWVPAPEIDASTIITNVDAALASLPRKERELLR